jgi:hypothetical protein
MEKISKLSLNKVRIYSCCDSTPTKKLTNVLFVSVSHDIDGGPVDVEILEAADEPVSQRGRPDSLWQLQVRVHVVHAAHVQAADEVQLIGVT